MDSLLYYFCGFLFFLGVFFYLKNKKQYHLPDLFFGVFSLAVFISIFGKVQWISYAIGLFAIFALVIGVTEKKFKPYPVLFCFVGAYLVRIIGLSYTPDIKYGLYFLETDLSLLLFPCIVSCLVVRKAAINLLWRGYFWVIIIFITFCFISFTIGASSSEIGAYNLKNWYPYLFNWLSSQHPSYYAIMALFAIPVGWLLFYKPEQKIKSLTKVILFSSYIGAFILFSGARIAILSYPVVLLLCWIYFSRWKSKAFRVGLVVSVLLIGVVSILMLKPELKKRFIDTPRLQMWPTALHSIGEHPLLGLGTGGIPNVLKSDAYAQSLGYDAALPFGNVHNQFLNEWVQFGLLGGSLFAAGIVWLFVVAIRKRDFLLFVFLVIESLFFLVEVPLDRAQGIVFFMFCISILVASQKARLGGESNKERIGNQTTATA